MNLASRSIGIYNSNYSCSLNSLPALIKTSEIVLIIFHFALADLVSTVVFVYREPLESHGVLF